MSRFALGLIVLACVGCAGSHVTPDAGPPTSCAPGCAPTEYCRHVGVSCTGATQCVSRPTGTCPMSTRPVCGCDGRDYANVCVAISAGVDVAFEGTCSAPTDCRVTGCPSDQVCGVCWSGWSCLPPHVIC